MPVTTRIRRARGCLLGMAVGDALGGPLEGLSALQIANHYKTVVDYVDGTLAWKKKPYRWRLPGLYTDDTQQALAIADVLLERRSLDANRLSELYLALSHPKNTYMGAHRGLGRSFHLVLAELERGVAPDKTGQLSAGIGAAMRIAPIAVYFAGKPEAMFEAVMAASLMTHRDVRSLAGAMAVAHCLRRIAAGARREPSLLLRVAADLYKTELRIAAEYGHLAQSIEPYLHAMSRAVARTESLLEAPREAAFAQIVEEANRLGAEPTCKRASQGFPPACIPTCLLIFLTAESFEDAIVETINLGGDTDSAGAIVGALAGAYFGEAEIPSRWLERLHNREGIGLRGEALARETADGLSIPDFVETERWLTREESRYRDNLLSQVQSGKGGDLGANRRL